MIKTDNLYSEVVINESPFYYDETSSLMNLSNSPSASLMNGAGGFNGQMQ